ncbi:hypothetical protein DFJ58DRAFT_224319 [Suillus subalutaceus]|uniref:uncharacterized protein n=1 Tax=Suillus subalutaceus TaxID=48586 RepID=UPI001B86D693|nr:uncharacterized protein DFJ58DRAFT_224319 [Suillus subalutaceus]KAG1833303.1 hypothetical protein DFJ58DRAFT_224319 [Suillus subalutaceus]
MDELSRTHYATPLAAFAFDGAIIGPGGYGRHLKGALVQVHFTLRHPKGKRMNTFRAKITAIRVLAPPPRIMEGNPLMYSTNERQRELMMVQELN